MRKRRSGVSCLSGIEGQERVIADEYSATRKGESSTRRPNKGAVPGKRDGPATVVSKQEKW